MTGNFRSNPPWAKIDFRTIAYPSNTARAARSSRYAERVGYYYLVTMECNFETSYCAGSA
jgi:hypothetical protein